MALSQDIESLVNFLTPIGIQKLVDALKTAAEKNEGFGEVLLRMELKHGVVKKVRSTSEIEFVIKDDWRDDANRMPELPHEASDR